MGPHPSGLPHPGLALGGGSGLLALSGALGAQLAAKDERAHLEAAAAAAAAAADHHRGTVALSAKPPLRSCWTAERVKVFFTFRPKQNDEILKNVARCFICVFGCLSLLWLLSCDLARGNLEIRRP